MTVPRFGGWQRFVQAGCRKTPPQLPSSRVGARGMAEAGRGPVWLVGAERASDPTKGRARLESGAKGTCGATCRFRALAGISPCVFEGMTSVFGPKVRVVVGEREEKSKNLCRSRGKMFFLAGFFFCPVLARVVGRTIGIPSPSPLLFGVLSKPVSACEWPLLELDTSLDTSLKASGNATIWVPGLERWFIEPVSLHVVCPWSLTPRSVVTSDGGS